MPIATNGPTEIYYETDGDPSGTPLLMIMGLGAQLVSWPPGVIDLLVDNGFFIIRHDNREMGLSTTSMDFNGTLADLFTTDMETPFLLDDLADDAVAVLDAVGITAAHVVGASLGGMIAQALAIKHPTRTLTLTSVMSSPGIPSSDPAVMLAMAELGDPTPEAYVHRSVEVFRLISGTSFDEVASRERAERELARGYHPGGQVLQTLAVIKSPDRTEALKALKVPALVIHGAQDPLVLPIEGEKVAAAIPGARHVVYEEMGHNLPEALFDEVVQELVKLTSSV